MIALNAIVSVTEANALTLSDEFNETGLPPDRNKHADRIGIESKSAVFKFLLSRDAAKINERGAQMVDNWYEVNHTLIQQVSEQLTSAEPIEYAAVERLMKMEEESRRLENSPETTKRN